MVNINFIDIIKKKPGAINESFLWCIFSMSLEAIQKYLDEKSEFILITPENSYITATGDLNFIYKDKYEDIYYFTINKILQKELVKNQWKTFTTDKKTQILLHSLSKTLNWCLTYKSNDLSQISTRIRSTINQISDPNRCNQINISNLQKITYTNAMEHIQHKSFNDYLMTIHRSIVLVPVRMRSQSASSSITKKMAKNGDRNISFEAVDQMCDLEETNSNQNSSSLNNSSIFSSNASENNLHISCLSASKSGNLYLNRMEQSNKPNIHFTMERARAMRKISKTNGPVKSPSILSNSSRSCTNLEKVDSSELLAHSVSLLSTPSGLKTNVERLDGIRRMLGPEFIIRQNEVFNVPCHLQRKSSIFIRSESGRRFNHDVQVHLLNGVNLLVKYLNKHSILSHVINAIHGAFPDLEFVNYGLCFKLDNEYFFVQEEMNIQKLVDYISQKSNSSKQIYKMGSKKILHLHHRIKFYPTMEIIQEMNSFNRKLFYFQLRQNLLFENNPPISLKESFSYAGISIQAEFGYNENNLPENNEYMKVQYYYHSLFRSLLQINGDEISFLKSNQKRWLNERWEKCEKIFIEKICQNKYYGMHWYRTNKNQHDVIGAIGKDTFLVIGRDSIQLLESSRFHPEIQIHKHFSYKWQQIESISIKHKKLEIKPKMQLKLEGLNTPNAFVCYVDSKTKAEHIVRLCNEHHLLASQNDELINAPTQLGSHRRLSTIDYPSFNTRRVSYKDLCNDDFDDYDDSENDDNGGDNSNVNIFIQDHSSNDNLDQSPQLLHDNKKFYFGSMSNLKIQKTGITNSYKYKTDDEIDQELLYENHSKLLLVPRSSSTKNLVTSNDLLKVDLTRNISSNESLGLGIIKIKNPTYEGIFIKRIMKGSPTDKCGKLQIGDEIVYINDKFVSNLEQSEVGKIIKNCGESIELLILKTRITKNKNDSRNKLIERTSSYSQTENQEPVINSQNVYSPINNKITNKTLQRILNSDNAFNFFQENIFKSTFPVFKLPNIGNLNQTSVLNLEKFVQKEIRQLKQAFNIRSENQMDDKREINNNSSLDAPSNIYDIKIQSRKLFDTNVITPMNDVFFTILETESKWNPLLWKFIMENSLKLIISVNSVLNNEVISNQHVNNEKNLSSNGHYSFHLDEKHAFSKSIVFYRLSVTKHKKDSSEIITHRCFIISYNNWNGEIGKTEPNDSIIQTINIACGINEHLPISGSILICTNQVDQKIGMFITMYSLILFRFHKNLIMSPIIKDETIVYAICSQFKNQMNKIMPNEAQYRMCISIVKHLIPYVDHNDSRSDISDIS